MIFNKQDTPILYYKPRGSQRWRDRRFFLYPAWMYRIVAPRTSANKLNILEKAILGLCNAGVKSADEMSNYLEIHRDLAALIIVELSDRKLVNSYGIPTESGKRILQDEISINEKAIAGYIFQDIWSNDLMPRFVETEERADTQLDDTSSFPKLNLGSVGQPNYQSLVMPTVQNAVAQTPSVRDILKAISSDSKAIAKASNSENENDRDLDDNDSSEDTWHTSQIASLERISFIEEEPTAVWLTTFAYLPENLSDEVDWLICDPFGLGDSVWLRKAIYRQFEQQNFRELHKRLLTMTESRPNQGTLTELMERYTSEAKQQVECKLSTAIKRWHDFYEEITRLQRYRIEIGKLDDPKQQSDRIETCLIQCQKIGEQVFSHLQSNYPPQEEWRKLSRNDKSSNRNFINALAEHIGFIAPIPYSLTNIDQNYVRSAAQNNKGSLRARIIAALLATRIFPDHSLHNLARSHPDILIDLDELADLRNASGHYNAGRASPETDLIKADRSIETIYKLVANILNLSYSPD